MTPFRTSPQEWDGKDVNGRYENRNGFKYDIVSKSIVDKVEEMPKCFLAETKEEAEEIYKRFEKTLNNLAYTYSISTGIERADLFRETLIGLARAYRDWQPERSEDFKTFAIFRIKDTLNEYVRNNAASVSVPSYVKKANHNLSQAKEMCKRYNLDWRLFLSRREIPPHFTLDEAMEFAERLSNISSAAKRAFVDYEKFIDRIEILPEDVDYSDDALDSSAPLYDGQNRMQEILEASLVVEKLKNVMTKTELFICEGIMDDKSYEKIGEEMGKSKGWVSAQLRNLKDKILFMIEKGTL